MSFNDGQKLLVFGLGYAQQDNRKMQHVLRHYSRLPSNPGSRSALFVELNSLARELMTDEAAQEQIQQLTEWMKNGGDFPLRIIPESSNAVGVNGGQQSELRATPGMQQGTENHILRPPSRVTGWSRQYYGRGRTLNDPTGDNTLEVASSDTVTDDDHNNNASAADHGPRTRSMGWYGRGHTIDDPPEAVESEDAEYGDVEIQDLDRDTQWGARVRQNYGQGHAINEAPESTEKYHISDTSSENEPEGPHGEHQLQSTVNEPTGVADVTHNVSSMHLDETRDAEQIECPICLEGYHPSNFPKRPTVTKLCDHPDKPCLQCLNSSITVMVDRGALHLLACPICPQKLSQHDIEEYTGEEVYKRYKYLKQQSGIPGHWISCTNTDCGGSQPHDSSDPKMICNHCKFATCAKHKRPWHDGQTCGEFDKDDTQIERLEEEEATAKLLSKESISICPNCGHGVSKMEGCDHMRCQCGQQWCYVCSCSWENILRVGTTAHATFCIYHPNKVNLTKAQQNAASARIMGLVHGGEVSAELAKARDELRQRRREEIRPKAAEAAEARRKQAMEEKREATPFPEKRKKKKVKLVVPWEEGRRTNKAL